jgi:transcriptional regulator with XRE-family HTH domain
MTSDRSIRAILASNVRHWREQRGWAPADLARRVGISNQRIAAIENGSLSDVRIGLVEAIAQALEVEVAELLTRPGPKTGAK